MHFDNIGHQLSKLGEEGKLGHRVIDLTRPEDLDGKTIFGSLSNAIFSAVLEKKSGFCPGVTGFHHTKTMFPYLTKLTSP